MDDVTQLEKGALDKIDYHHERIASVKGLPPQRPLTDKIADPLTKHLFETEAKKVAGSDGGIVERFSTIDEEGGRDSHVNCVSAAENRSQAHAPASKKIVNSKEQQSEQLFKASNTETHLDNEGLLLKSQIRDDDTHPVKLEQDSGNMLNGKANDDMDIDIEMKSETVDMEDERSTQELSGTTRIGLTAEDIQILRVQKKALDYISRGMPLPSSICQSLLEVVDSGTKDWRCFKEGKNDQPGMLWRGFRQAMRKEEGHCPASELRRRKEKQIQQFLQLRLSKLEVAMSGNAPSHIKQKALIESKGIKLLNLQKKVRFEVSAERRLQQLCENPRQLFDWSLMRPQRNDVANSLARWDLRGSTTNHFAIEIDMKQRRRRDVERRALEERIEKQKIAEGRARFMTDLINTVKEFGGQSVLSAKRRKQRNDGVLAWHMKQRQRASRAERLRVQALKTGDQEAYLQLVEESKNERLKMFLSKTNELLQGLGAMVQQQKQMVENYGQSGVASKSIDSENVSSILSQPKIDQEPKPSDLLEGQRQYNAAAHSIIEKVAVQPESLKGGQLREYQVEGLQWMLSLFNNNLNGILADEMGLGKTIQTIALVAYLAEKKGVTGPHLILAPKAVLPNWAHEFATWLPSIKAVVYDGKQEDRKSIRDNYSDGSFNVMITHYDLIMRDKAFLRKIRWHYLVVDEGHRLKNHESVLAKTLVAGYQIRRRLLLTGTPIQNNLTELWSLLNFILPAVFNSNGNFDDWFNAPFADKSEVSLTEEEELLVIRRLHEVIRPFLLRRKKNEVEKFLPQKTQVILKCNLSAWQRTYYSQIIEDGKVGLAAKGQTRSLQNTAMQLRKCCNHPFLFLDYFSYEHFDKMDMIRASGKFEVLDKMLPKLRTAGHRILLFSQMTSLMNILEDFLTFRGFQYLRLDGNTKTEERSTLLQKFNAPDSPYFIFLLSTRAGGLGLNLQTADTVILFDSDWNPQMDQQAEDRAHRIGQKKEVRVFVLVSVGSIEEEILERAKSKMGIDAKVIQAGLFNTTSTANERRALLEEIMKKGSSQIMAEMPSEKEVNKLLARNDNEFKLFEAMDAERKKNQSDLERKKAPLMTEDELPEWVKLEKKSEAEVAAEVEAERILLSGKRKRNQVLNVDALSEAQWQMVEEGMDLAEVVKLGEEKKLKLKAKKGEQEGEKGEETSKGEQAEDDEMKESDVDMKLKIKKRQRDGEGDEEELKPKKRRGRIPGKVKDKLVEKGEVDSLSDDLTQDGVVRRQRSNIKRARRSFEGTALSFLEKDEEVGQEEKVKKKRGRSKKTNITGPYEIRKVEQDLVVEEDLKDNKAAEKNPPLVFKLKGRKARITRG